MAQELLVTLKHEESPKNGKCNKIVAKNPSVARRIVPLCNGGCQFKVPLFGGCYGMEPGKLEALITRELGPHFYQQLEENAPCLKIKTSSDSRQNNTQREGEISFDYPSYPTGLSD